MSRIGKLPTKIPDKTEVTVHDGVVAVKGPHGELTRSLSDEVAVEVIDGEVVVTPKNDTTHAKALWGTYASHIKNMVHGVNEPYQKKLIIEGVGYRAEVKGDTVILHVGFSHLVEIKVPEDIIVTVEKNTITIVGINKESVGQLAAEIRAVRKPEPYKGKGIRYEDEIVRRKEGKKTA